MLISLSRLAKPLCKVQGVWPAVETGIEFDSVLQHSLCRLGAQRKAVYSIYHGRDIFVWLPTGFGKSLCYEVIQFVMDHKFGRVGSAASPVLLVSPPIVEIVGCFITTC